MMYQMFTHNKGKVRRFFVNETMRNLIHELEGEVHRIMVLEKDGFKDVAGTAALADFTNYVSMRVSGLDYSSFKDFVDRNVLCRHLQDYCDIIYSRYAGPRNPRLPFRMLDFSEPTLLDKLDEEKAREKES